MRLNAFNCSASSRGFTLIELMITVMIIALLASVALPSYSSYVARARRADARAQLIQAAQFMQRFYSANDSYSNDRAGTGVFSVMPATLQKSPADGSAIYQLDTTAPSTTSYTLSIVPVSGGPAANDKCGTLTLTSAGVRGCTIGGTACTTAQRDECWR